MPKRSAPDLMVSGMSLASAHWFDFVVIVAVIAGFKIGQRKETLPQLLAVVHWALTLLLCTLLYKAPALWLAKKLSMQPDVMALIIFPVEFAVVYFLLMILRRRFSLIMEKAEPFGRWERHLTKLAGALLFLVYLLVIMAWISGRYVTEKDIRDHEAFCKENFGGITYPVLCTVNDDIFNKSFTGKFSRRHLDSMLMTALPRFDYGEKPAPAIVQTSRKAQLRELGNDFELKDKKEGTGKEMGGKGSSAALRDGDVNERSNDNAAKSRSSGGSGGNTYHDITLKGISGSEDNPFALINDQTFRAGELSSIKFEDQKIMVQCIQILKNSALVRLDNQPETIELKLGIATNLKGEPVAKE